MTRNTPPDNPWRDKEAFLARSQSTGAARSILLACFDFANVERGMTLWASKKTIAKRAGVCPRTANREFKKLLKWGELECVHASPGGRTPSTYRIVMEGAHRSDRVGVSESVSPNSGTTPEYSPPQHWQGASPAMTHRHSTHDNTPDQPWHHARGTTKNTNELTTNTTMSLTTEHAHATRDAHARQTNRDDGGGSGEFSSDLKGIAEKDIDAAADAIPTYVNAAARRDRARDACKLASQFGGTGADIVAFVANLVAGSSEKARPGRFVNMVRHGREQVDKRAYAAFLADKPRRDMLHWLTSTPDGKRHWAEVYTPEARAWYPSEEAARADYVKRELEKQARGGAA